MDDAAHPLLPAGTPVLRCSDGAVQIGGVDSGAGVLVAPGAGWVHGLLAGLDGRRSQRALVDDAARGGALPAEARAVLDALRGQDLLVDLDAADLLAADAGPSAAARTATELHGALRGPAPDGVSPSRARRTACVVVEGATRVGAPLAAVLAASGVGRVAVHDDGTAGAADAVVGGLTADDEGRPRAVAAADAVRRVSPLTDLRPLPDPATADLVVLTRPWASSDPLVAGLHADGVPHLVATVRGRTGVVGPLVVPGRTSCLRCADLHRRDADPRWPVLAAQLTAGEPPPSGATTTCLLTAATAAVQVLAYLDGGAAPAVLGATLELQPADPVPRRRDWRPHPACGCLPVPTRGSPASSPGSSAAPPARAPATPVPAHAGVPSPRRRGGAPPGGGQ